MWLQLAHICIDHNHLLIPMEKFSYSCGTVNKTSPNNKDLPQRVLE